MEHKCDSYNVVFNVNIHVTHKQKHMYVFKRSWHLSITVYVVSPLKKAADTSSFDFGGSPLHRTNSTIIYGLGHRGMTADLNFRIYPMHGSLVCLFFTVLFTYAGIYMYAGTLFTTELNSIVLASFLRSS